MKPTVYIETSVISYLTARPSNDIRSAACQNITAEWWESRRRDFELYISEFVVVEASRGNEDAAAKRVKAIAGIAKLDVAEAVRDIARALLEEGSLPPKAEIDAFHVAVAAVNGMNYLLTWNCTHIANAEMRPKIENLCRDYGLEPPVICTPLELLEG